MADPVFDPSQPYTTSSVPVFDPSKPYSTNDRAPMSPEEEQLQEAGPVASGEAFDQFFTHSAVGRVLHAFGQGAANGWGDQPLGLSDEASNLLKKWDIFPNGKPGEVNIAKTFNEAILRPLAVGADVALRLGYAPLTGATEALEQASEEGLPGAKPAAELTGGVASGAFMPGMFGVPHLRELQTAKSLSVIGDSDAAWKGLVPPQAESPLEASERAASDQPKSENITPIQKEPAAPDIHQIARQIDPDTMQAYDALTARQDAVRQQIQQVGPTIDAQIADMEARAKRVKPAAAAVWERRAQDLRDNRDDLVSQQEQTLRQRLQEIDFQMRDLAPNVSAAYRNAQDRMENGALPTAQPDQLLEPAVTQEPIRAEPQIEAPQPVSSAPEQIQSIKDDVTQKLIAAGRPEEEARASAELSAALWETRAQRFQGAKGSALDMYNAQGATIKPELQAVEPAMAQGKRGSVTFDNGRAIISMMKDSNASTFVHETGHEWLERLMSDANDPQAPADLVSDSKTVRDWLGSEDKITRAQHEKFARGFERYLMEGVAPSKGLARVFEQFRQWLTTIYQTVAKLKSPINDDIRSVFDRLLSNNPERQPLAEKQNPAKILADIHEADARTTPSIHAKDAADQIEPEISSIAKVDPKLQEVIDGNRGTGLRESAENEPGAGGVGAESTDFEPGGERGAPAPSAINKRSGISASKGATESGPHEPFVDQESPLVDKAGNIRLDNMDAPEDVKQAFRDIALRNDDFMSERGGVISDAQVLQMAEASGLSFEDIDKFAKTMRMGPVVIKAAERMFIQASGEAQVASKAFTEAPNETNEMAAIKAIGRLEMIQGTFSRLTSDPGRMLRALSKSDEWRTLGIPPEEGISEATGRTPQQWRTLFQAMANLDTPAKVAKMVRDSTKPTFGNMIVEYYVNNLISGPATHTTYMLGNTLLALYSATLETGAAALIGNIREALGQTVSERVYLGEVREQLYGMMRGYRDGAVAAIEAWKSGITASLPGETIQPTLPSMVAGQQGSIPGLAGTAIRLPSRGVTAIHSLYRTMNYERSIAALSYRQAMSEGLDGEPLAARLAELRNDPSEELMEQARAEANKMTLMQKPAYQSPMWYVEKLANSSVPTKLVAPFVRIGGAIVQQSLIDRSLMGIANGEVRDNLLGKNGDVARDFQAAKIAVGSALSVMMVGLALEGLATGGGPQDPKQRAMKEMTGWQPYSVKFGDFYVPYKRLGVLGMLMGTAAEGVDLAHEMSGEDASKWAATLTLAVSNTVLDETWMSTVSSVVKAINDPERYGEAYIKNLATSFIPYSVGLGQIAGALDPYQRQTTTMLNALRNKVPFLREENFPRRDIWGEPIKQLPDIPVSGLTALSVSQINHDPVNQAMLEVGAYPAKLEKKIRNVELTEQQYDDYQRLAGRYARMRVDQLIQNPGWGQIPIEIRREALMKTISAARQAAASSIMMQSVGSANDIVKQATDAKLAKMGKAQ